MFWIAFRRKLLVYNLGLKEENGLVNRTIEWHIFCIVPQEGAGVASSTDGEGDDEMSSSGTGFFISFDNKTPKRQKPKLKSREKKVKHVHCEIL